MVLSSGIWAACFDSWSILVLFRYSNFIIKMFGYNFLSQIFPKYLHDAIAVTKVLKRHLVQSGKTGMCMEALHSIIFPHSFSLCNANI